jgi:hypothetical protein
MTAAQTQTQASLDSAGLGLRVVAGRTGRTLRGHLSLSGTLDFGEHTAAGLWVHETRAQLASSGAVPRQERHTMFDYRVGDGAC